MASLVGILALVFLGGTGSVFLLGGGGRLRQWWTMRRLDPTVTAVGEGLQEIEGRAHPVEGTVTGQYSGSESLICTHEVERYSSAKGSNSGRTWSTVTKETQSVPFEVHDGGASVAVDPGNAQYLLGTDYEREAPRNEFSERHQALIEEAAGSNTAELGPIELESNHRYRLTESRLDPGEDVYVVGRVRSDPSALPRGSDARMAIAPDDRGLRDFFVGDPFVVSDSGAETAARRQLKAAGFSIGIALLLYGMAAVFWVAF